MNNLFDQIKTMKNDKHIQAFIFNWRDKFDSTLAIESALYGCTDTVDVINSSAENLRAYWHNIGEGAYFTDQFLKALDIHDGSSVFFHIQGDTSYNNWPQLVQDARHYMQKYNAGIYYPKVNNVEWQSDELASLKMVTTQDTNIKYIVNGDETVWFIHPRVVQYFKYLDLEDCFLENKMGWGWDIVFCAVSHMIGMPVIRDSNHTIEHSPSRTYDQDLAHLDYHNTFCKLPTSIKDYIKLVYDRKDLTPIAKMLF